MSLFTVNLGVSGLGDVGYIWKDEDGVDIATRTEFGVSEIESGIYGANLTPPAGAEAIFWNSDTEDPLAFALGDGVSFASLKSSIASLLTLLGTPSNLGGGADLANNLSDMAGATFSDSTDSLESIRDQTTAGQIRGALGLVTANLDTQLATSLAKLRAYFQLALRIDTDTDLATELAEINADLGSGAGTYAAADGSQQEAGSELDSILISFLSDAGHGLPALKTLLDSTLADTNELQTDWADGGRLDLLIDALATSTISGAHPVTVTVTDGTNPLEGATVRVIEGVNDEAKLTDASGNATFTLDPATWTVYIVKDGYQGISTTRTVTGDQAGTLVDTDLELTLTVIPSAPADPGACTVYGYLKKADGTAAASVAIDIALAVPSGAAKSDMLIVLDTITLTTNGSGEVPPTEFERQDFITSSSPTIYLVTCEELGWQNKRMSLTAATYDLADLVG